MKRILLVIAVLLGTYQLTNAQIKKGSQNLGIDLTYEHATNEETISSSSFLGTTKTSNVRIAPAYGYFICDGTELGGSIYYSSAKRDYDATSGFKNNSSSSLYGAFVYLNKYVLLNEVIGFRGGPYVNYGWGTTTESVNAGNATKNNDKNFSAGARLDLVYYPTQNFGLAMHLLNVGYTHQTSKGTAPTQIDLKVYTARLFTNFTGISVFYVLGKK